MKRNLLILSISLVFWIFGSAWYYTCKIKGLCITDYSADYVNINPELEETKKTDEIVLDIPEPITTQETSLENLTEETNSDTKKVLEAHKSDRKEIDPYQESRNRTPMEPLKGYYAIIATYSSTQDAIELATKYRIRGEMAYVLENDSGNHLVGIFLAQKESDSDPAFTRVKKEIKNNAWQFKFE